MRWVGARLIAALFVTLACVALADQRPALAKTFEITALATDAELAPDASMAVVETVTYDFDGGPFTAGIRSFEPRSRAQIVDFAASDEEGRALRTIPPNESISGEWEWEFDPTTDARRTFTLSYGVVDAASVGPDVGELYWKFLGTDHPGVGQVAVRVALPGNMPPAQPETPDDDATVVRAWAHGPSSGVVTNLGTEVELRVGDVPAGQFVEARIAVPAAAFTAEPSGPPRLPTILTEERAYIDDQESQEQRALAGSIAAPIVALLGVGGFLVVWRKWGKEPPPPDTIGDYWREPLDDPPAVTATNLQFGTVPNAAFSATVVDLAQRGYLRIEEVGEGRSHDYRFTWVGNAKDQLLPHEQDLLEHLFRSQPSTTGKEFAAWAKGDAESAQRFWQGWKKQVRKEVDTRGYIDRGRVAPWVAWAAVTVALLLGGVITLALGSWLAILPLAAGGIVLVLGVLMRRRTTRGAEKAEEAKALRRFLKDFSTLDEAPVASLAIWERYLVAAVTLGVAGDLVRGLAMKVPEVAAAPGFATWYVASGGLHRLDGIGRFGNDFASTAVSAMAPSSSGSGGGFSGGGGGGGGGGGFGAR